MSSKASDWKVKSSSDADWFERKDLLPICQEMMTRSIGQDEIITYLHAQGLPIIECIKIIRHLYQVSLGEAKRVVSNHPAWANFAKQWDEFHQELEETLLNEQSK
jgi:hypothetical protein